MLILIKDRDGLKRLRRLLTTLDNRTSVFPITFYNDENETAAFMDGVDREFLATTTDSKVAFRFSDREGARDEWLDRELKQTRADLAELQALASQDVVATDRLREIIRSE